VEHGIEIETIQPYIDAFKYGAMPHGGRAALPPSRVSDWCSMEASD
jgi:aspartyl/asparaginyl-tRNA synthetase